jgi:hypothetical protein
METDSVSIPQPPADADRALLQPLSPYEANLCGQAFHDRARRGIEDPAASVALATATIGRWSCEEERPREAQRAAAARRLLDALARHPEEAEAFARACIAWAALPREERERRKAERAAQHRQAWLEAQPATPKQLAYLAALGHRGPVANRHEAGLLIDRYTTARKGGAA